MGDIILNRAEAGQTFSVQMVAPAGTAVETGVTISGLEKDGTNGTATSTIAHQANGRWRITASEADIDAERIAFQFTGGGAVPVTMNVSTEVLSLSDIYGNGLITGKYTWSTDTTETDPGTGGAKANNATYASITEVYVSAETNKGQNIAAAIERLQVGDFLVIQKATDASKYFNGTVSGAVVNNGGWYSIPISIKDSGSGTIANGNNVELGMFFDRAAWTDAEKQQIRYRLQMDGQNSAPSTDTPAQLPANPWDGVRSSHIAAGSFGETYDLYVAGTVSGAVAAPTSTVFAAANITEATTDHFVGRTIIFLTGNRRHEATNITGYALVSGEGQFTVTALTTAPADGDRFLIV